MANETAVAIPGVGTEAVELLGELIRFDTVNPPGNERPAQEMLAQRFADAGFECELIGAEPERPNLIARLAGESAGRDAVPARPRRHGSAPTRASGPSTRGRATSSTGWSAAAAPRT